MSRLIIYSFLYVLSWALTTNSHAQENKTSVDTLPGTADTTNKKMDVPATSVTTDSLHTKRANKKKKKKNDNGENPYLVGTPPAKPLPYNSPKDKTKTPEEAPLGGILKDIIIEKKKQ